MNKVIKSLLVLLLMLSLVGCNSDVAEDDRAPSVSLAVGMSVESSELSNFDVGMLSHESIKTFFSSRATMARDQVGTIDWIGFETHLEAYAKACDQIAEKVSEDNAYLGTSGDDGKVRGMYVYNLGTINLSEDEIALINEIALDTDQYFIVAGKFVVVVDYAFATENNISFNGIKTAVNNALSE